MKREAAWRVFAGEFNDSTFEIKGDGDMKPSYVITPLGAKINRIFISGVLTDVENVSENSELIRAHVSDPTGVFTIYSGNYQQDITDKLKNIDVPAFVAIIGKSRTYIPEEGTMFVSIRPEDVVEVDSSVRDRWILDTCQNTKERIYAVLEAKKMNTTNSYDLKKIGYSNALSEGIVESFKHYSDVDLDKYVNLIKESLEYITPGKSLKPEVPIKKKKQAKNEKTEEEIEDDEKIKTDAKPKSDEKDKKTDEAEKKIFEIIKNIEGEEGAAWDDITEKCKKEGFDEDLIEESLNSLMDKGLIYEPILGTIKTT